VVYGQPFVVSLASEWFCAAGGLQSGRAAAGACDWYGCCSDQCVLRVCTCCGTPVLHWSALYVIEWSGQGGQESTMGLMIDETVLSDGGGRMGERSHGNSAAGRVATQHPSRVLQVVV